MCRNQTETLYMRRDTIDMKTFRVLGAVFCIFGCIFALLGILTTVLPMIENEQFKLIVDSFQETSADPLTNTLNAIVNFVLHSGYFLFFLGISLTVAGGLIGSSAHRRQKAAKVDVPEVAPYHISSEGSGTPKPAYYPGGLPPPVEDAAPDRDSSAVPIVSTMKMPTVQILPDDDEPETPSIESDSRKLAHNDAVLSAQSQFKRPAQPDYSRYPSNTAPPPSEEETNERQETPPQQRPKIVSTMGKKPL